MRYTLYVRNAIKGVTITDLGVQLSLPTGLSLSKAYTRPLKDRRAPILPIVNATVNATQVNFLSMSLGSRKRRKLVVVAKAAANAPLNIPLSIEAVAYQAATTNGVPYCAKPADPVTVRSCDLQTSSSTGTFGFLF